MTLRFEQLFRWSGVSLILFSALARVFTSQSRIPYWDIDPLTSWSPDTTRTPAMSLLFDALVWLAASAIIDAEGRANRPIAWKTGLLALIGCVGVALHGWIITPLTAVGGSPPTHGDFQSMLLGSTWASAIIGAWALSMAARDPQVKRATATTLLGVVIVLAAKGAMQVFIDHPRLVAEFATKKDEMLTSQGFQPGSVSARLFERRLIQSEATGWFGLSNVYGSFVAAGTAAFLALAISATRAARKKVGATACPEGQAVPRTAHVSGEAALLWLATAIAATGLALSGSKGAVGAAAIGCPVVVLLQWVQTVPPSSRGAAQASSPRRNPGDTAPGDSSSSTRERATGPNSALSTALRSLLRYSPIIFPLLALLAICLRGLLGERIGELSLYFRWQYLLGASRIILAHPIFGTGPAGFKDQYLLFKEPTNPEEIDSPHCLPMDWLATMGVFGAAWVILWIIWLWRTGSAVGATTDAAALGGSVVRNARNANAPLPSHHAPETGCMVAPPLIIFASLAFSLWAEWATYVPELLIIMMLAGLAWWFTARTASRLAAADTRALNIALFGAAIVLGTHCMIEVTGVFTSSAPLTLAMVGLSGLPHAQARVGAKPVWILSMATTAIIGILLVFTSLATAVLWESELREAALEAREFRESRSSLWGVAQRLMFTGETELQARVWFMVGGATVPSDEGSSDSAWINPIQLLERECGRSPRSPTWWMRLGGTIQSAVSASGESSTLSYAIGPLERGAALDPHGLTPPLHLARLYAQLNQRKEAARWAARALEIHANLHLDPLKGLTDAEKSEMEHLATPPAPPFPDSTSPQAPTPPSSSTP